MGPLARLFHLSGTSKASWPRHPSEQQSVLVRRGSWVSGLAVVLITLSQCNPTPPPPPPGPCEQPIANPIVCENTKPGTPESEWDIWGARDPSIVGFTDDISADVGSTVNFKIDTPSHRLPPRHLPPRLLPG